LIGFKSGSIDKIITDPPWGISVGTDLNLLDFYSKMLTEFRRVVKTNGRLIILMGNKEIFEKVLKSYFSDFKLEEKYDILVSGKKASVYKLIRN